VDDDDHLIWGRSHTHRGKRERALEKGQADHTRGLEEVEGQVMCHMLRLS